MQDLQEQEFTQSYLRAPSKMAEAEKARAQGEGKKGFVVKGAPWDAASGGSGAGPTPGGGSGGAGNAPSRAPDMKSDEDFPSFGAPGGLRPAGGEPGHSSAPLAWGPRKARF
jgi:hypothetical protein